MAGSFLTSIRHVVVVMLENRSFDHLCGWLGRGDGLTPEMGNREDPANPASPVALASRDAAYVGDLTIDPAHSLLDVNQQLFSSVLVPEPPTATNGGFVANYATRPGNTPLNAHRIMHAFDPAKLPVLATLANEFVLCDRWFASVPAQTWPNRFFVHAATSGGFADNQFREYRFDTVYDRLDDAGYDWSIYFHDFPHAYTIQSLRKPSSALHFKFAKQFFLDVKHGRLPPYSFIEPRYFDFLRWKANDNHPPHDVRLGEHLIADIYESLRRSSAWESLLLIVLYDEHGGLYDHVAPPAAVNPDGKLSSSPPFGFDRLGVRVPALVISPWVQKGSVDSTVFDHTSVIATLRQLFAIGGPLTRRDDAANTLTHLLQPAARSDTPMTLTRPPEPTADAFHDDSATAAMTPDHVAADMATGLASSAPLSEFQRSLVETSNALQATQPARSGVVSLARLVDNEHECAVHVRDLAARLFDRQR
jgi:phospholipase C